MLRRNPQRLSLIPFAVIAIAAAALGCHRDIQNPEVMNKVTECAEHADRFTVQLMGRWEGSDEGGMRSYQIAPDTDAGRALQSVFKAAAEIIERGGSKPIERAVGNGLISCTRQTETGEERVALDLFFYSGGDIFVYEDEYYHVDGQLRSMIINAIADIQRHEKPIQ